MWCLGRVATVWGREALFFEFVAAILLHGESLLSLSSEAEHCMLRPTAVLAHHGGLLTGAVCFSG